jgi:signal transduction histidine kinase/CheY-like chemotaxis protein
MTGPIRSFLNNMPLPTALLDKNNMIIDANSALLILLDITIEQLKGKHLFRVFILDNQPSNRQLEPDITMLEDFTAYSAEYIDNGKSSKKVTLSRGLLNDTKEVFVFVCLDNHRQATSISLNRQLSSLNQVTSVSLDGQLSSLNQAINGASIGIWKVNFTNNTDCFSEKFRELIDVTKNALFTWKKFRSMILEEDIAIFDISFKYFLERGIPLCFEFRLVVKGQIRWFEIKVQVVDILTKDGDPISIIGSLIDCTRNKETITALNKIIESKDNAIEAGKIGTWHAEINSEKDWVWSWNRLTNEMFGLETGGASKLKKWIARLHPEDEQGMIQAIDESLSRGKLFNHHFRILMPEGEIRYIKGTGQVRQNILGDHDHIDGIFIDQSAISQAQKKLKQLNSELEERVAQRTKELVLSTKHAEQASKIKTDFLSMMSHELRTPMNGVIGSLDLLTTTKQTEESMDLIDIAKTSAENLVSILNDILDINKVEAGKLEIEDRAFAISEVIDDVVKAYIPIAKKKNIVFEVYEQPDIPKFVSGDAMRVRQILFNLIGNAIKFTSTSNEKTGSIKLLAEIADSNQHLSSISFTVLDNGIGIDRETQQKLFMPFSQAERSTTRKYGGTGLGLAICAQLTEMMGGSITLNSEKGAGSSFCVEVPFWLSQETNALAVELLSSVNVAFVDVSKVDANRKDTLSKYLVDEGAEVTYVAHDLKLDFSLDFDVILIFVGDLAIGRDHSQLLLTQLSEKNKIILAIDDNHLEKSKQAFPGMRIISTQPITRVQFLGAINNLWQKRHELVLDELDLEGLCLNIENKEVKPLNSDILIVEDNPLNQKIIIKQMRNIGYECDLAEDGEQGIEKWINNSYKLILTDCHMPNMDGYQMTQAIRKLEKSSNREHIPIIAVTGAAMTGDAERCYKAGMDSFVSKPVQLVNLREVLKEWYHYD